MLKRWLAAAAAVIGVAMVSATVAHAADLTIPIDTVIDSGIAEGEEVVLETVATADLEGATCEVRSVRRDRDEIETNSGNNLVVASGQGTTTLEDVEHEPRAVTEGFAITLGPRISITLMMGEHQRFAAGIDVELDCGLTDVTTQTATDDFSATDESRTAAEPAQAAETLFPASTTPTPADLPVTGSETAVGALLSLVFVSIGAALVLAARRPAAS